MIRFGISLLVFVVGTCASILAEELPAPKVPAPPKPGLFTPELPLPDLSVPNNAPAAKPQAVVAPDSLLPTPAPANAIVKESNNNVPDDLKWRYKWHNGQWWYWSPASDNTAERWMIWDQNSWTPYDPATYQAPAGFAQPGPRVVNQTSNYPLALPESYSTSEISVPQSYYLTPRPTYIAPTPYAFGVDSYYGPYGPAASYYNRRGGVSISIGTPAYVPVYGYPSYSYPGYYGGRGVSIGFGF